MVQERYLWFHFCSHEQTLLSPHVSIPPISLGTLGHLPLGVLQPFINTQVPLCLHPSKSLTKAIPLKQGYSVSAS